MTDIIIHMVRKINYFIFFTMPCLPCMAWCSSRPMHSLWSVYCTVYCTLWARRTDALTLANVQSLYS